MSELSDYKRLVERPQMKALRDENSWLRSALASIMNSCNSHAPPTYSALAEVARRGLESHRGGERT